MNTEIVYVIAAHPFYIGLYVCEEEYAKSSYTETTEVNFYDNIDINKLGLKCKFNKNNTFLEIF